MYGLRHRMMRRELRASPWGNPPHYEPFLINPKELEPVSARRAAIKTEKRKKTMAKGKKRRSAAQKAATARMIAANKRSRKGTAKRTVRRVVRVKSAGGHRPVGTKVMIAHGKHRTVHTVKRYHRKGGGVKSYKRGPANVASHISNYRRRARRNPMGLPTMRQAGNDIADGLMTAGVILITLWATGMVNRKVQEFPVVAVGWPNVLAKLGTALVLGYGAGMVIKSPKYKHVIMGSAFVPALLSGVAQVAPGIAAQATMGAELNAPLQMQIGREGGFPRTRISDYTMAEAGKVETDQSMF
jgi:hypothetical protein